MERECMEKINHYCQKKKLTLVYADVKMTGPSHDPEFTVVVKIDNVEYGTGTGKNKKEAKAVAAKNSWEMIEKQPENPSNIQAAELTTSPVTLLPASAHDYVSLLNVYSQRTHCLVDYTNIKRTGDDHAPTFSCSCTVNGFVRGIGTGPSLGVAKQAAAKQAFKTLEKEGALTVGNEKSNCNSTFSEHSNSSEVLTRCDSDSSIYFEDSDAKLVRKMEDMVLCENSSPSQRHAQSAALKSKRKLAPNFDNAKNKEEKKKMSDSDEDLDINTSENNESPCTVNKRFLGSFKNIKAIGEGGFGNVFKATGKLDEQTYAVKRVCFTENVKREVKELASLHHENIVRYYSSWQGYDRVTDPLSR
ncbi:PREDICTED: interferon-induced, double-stranded RNA-activated protein kinase-like [Mesitornis unicolor]|uniref:interferon-induced, double-stranded RNA-activated protein kinase-like n=1 Tax=Mesitornis unicolor TaxID=54374 RepID=UPI000528DD4D|nr:PREDICTED: interferon-induced, double-stranded RNA-activated protein kinase-like [Mesitornis unicolor]